MKTTLIASVVLTSLAGAAAAGVMMSMPTRDIGTIVERTTPKATASPATVATAPAAAPAPAAVPAPTVATAPVPSARPSAPVEAARPPVPLRLTHKAPLPEKPAKPDSKAGSTSKTSTDTPEKAEMATDDKAQQAARAAIEADGYKGVQMLNQVGNGVWKASALRGKTRIVVNVDAAGNVFTE